MPSRPRHSHRGMSRASSLQSFVDPMTPLSVPALDSFLQHAADAGGGGVASSHQETAASSPSNTGRHSPAPATRVAVEPMDPDALAQRTKQQKAEPFHTAYFRGKPTAEAFAEHRAARVSDAQKRLSDLRRAEAARTARLNDIRLTQYAKDSRRARRVAGTERRLEEACKHTEEALERRQHIAEARRRDAAEARAQALRTAEAHRLEVRARYAALTEANTVVNDPVCQAACRIIAPLSHRLNSAFHAAAASNAPEASAATDGEGSTQPPFARRTQPFSNELHGRVTHANVVEAVEESLIRDPFLPCAQCGSGTAAAAPKTGPKQQHQRPAPVRPMCPKTGARHAQRLPAAAGDLLDALLAGAGLPGTPEVSPARNSGAPPSPMKLTDDAISEASPDRAAPTTTTTTTDCGDAPSPVGVSAEYLCSVTSWARLEDPASRDLVCRQLIGAHHAAAEYLNPSAAARRMARGGDANTADPAAAAFGAAHVLGGMAVTLVRELHMVIATVAGDRAGGDGNIGPCPRVHHRRVLRLLGAWDAYCVAAAEEELRKKKALVVGMTDALVQMRLAEHARARDIRDRALTATAAGPTSAQARREKAVAPRRAALTSAVSQQIATLVRRLGAVGGDAAVAAAEARASEAVAAVEAQLSGVAEVSRTHHHQQHRDPQPVVDATADSVRLA